MADSKYTVQDLQDNLAYLEETKRQIEKLHSPIDFCFRIREQKDFPSIF